MLLPKDLSIQRDNLRHSKHALLFLLSGSAFPNILQATRVPPQPVPTTPPPTCGPTNLIAQDTEQEFTSPNYPNNYPNGFNCVWNINNNDNSKSAVLSFTSFSTEDGYDKVKIYLDGSLTNTLTGSNVNTGPFRFSREAKIEFSSDGSQTSSGFRAVFKAGSYLHNIFV